MAYEPLEDKRMYRRAEEVADAVWNEVLNWSPLAQRTVGEQLIRASDSIGANIAEAGGRFHPADVCKFFYYSRGSLRETIFFLRRALNRHLTHPDLVAQLCTNWKSFPKSLA